MEEKWDNTQQSQQTWTRFNLDGSVNYAGNPKTIDSVLESFSLVKPDKRPKPQGWLFPTPYDREQLTERRVNGELELRYEDSGYYDTYRGPVWDYLNGTPAYNLYPSGDAGLATPWPNVDHVSQAESKALNKLLTHGKQIEGNFSAGQAWAERRETADLLNSTARKVLQGLKDLKAGRPKKAFNDLFPNGSLKDWKRLKGTPYWQWYAQRQKKAASALSPSALASGYLALQNGWKPLLNDVHNAAEALANRDNLADWVITGKGYYKVFTSEVIPGQIRNQPKTRFEMTQVITKAVLVRIDATVVDQHLHALAQLGLNNPASLQWEITPLSYIFDYFIGIGDWLQSLGAASGMQFYSGSLTRFGECITQVRSSPGSSKFSGRRWWRKFSRTPYKAFPVPIAPLSLKPQSLNLWQLGNIAAVAVSLLTGRPSDLRQ